MQHILKPRLNPCFRNWEKDSQNKKDSDKHESTTNWRFLCGTAACLEGSETTFLRSILYEGTLLLEITLWAASSDAFYAPFSAHPLISFVCYDYLVNPSKPVDTV